MSIEPEKRPSISWLLFLCLALTIVAYLPSFNAGFVNWDDAAYTYENADVRDFSLHGLLFHPVTGNHHPLTMLTLALNYAISADHAWSYHVLNLLLHLVNVVLAFFFALRLSEGRRTVALVVALLFGIHPMHVESVAWVSGRKDLLYAAFFLLGLIAYLRFVERRHVFPYFAALALSLLGMLSKPAAVIFPVALFTIDFLRGRRINVSLFAEKVPFFLAAAVMGVVTLKAQQAEGAMDNLVFFPFISRVLFGSYGLMMYVFRLFVPVRMAAFYPYPAINTSLPAIYYASPLFSAVLAGLCAWTWFRRRSRVVTFGIAFYVVNLLLVLQVLTVGSAVMADRYTYVPYIGLFFILGYGLDWWMSRSPVSLAPTAVTGVAALVLTGTAFGQASTWKNGAALWDHALRVCPSARAYVNRGTLLRKEGNNARALAMYSEALRLNKKDHEAFANRGNIYFDMGENDKAMRDYDHALAIKPDFSTVLANRASLYSRLQKYDAALADFGKAIALKPDDAPPYKNRALTLMVLKRYDGAVKDFEKYLRFDPDNAGIYNEIGVCYQGMGKYEESLAPLTRAIKLADNPTFLLNRSISYNHLGREREAMADIAAARRLGATTTPGFLSGLGLAAPTGGKPATTAPVPSYPANPLTAGPSPVDRGATVRATNAQR